MLQILLLILLISQRPERNSQIFWKSVSARISEFFDLHRRSAQDTDASHLHHLGLGKNLLHGQHKFKNLKK